MPFTPFHMGPGILVKSLLRGSFSLLVFGWAQIVMDLQPLVVLLTGEGRVHGLSHTYVGAALLGGMAAVSGKYLSELGLMLLGLSTKENPKRILWRAAWLSGFVGTFSHIALDSFMHFDITPLYPFSPLNGLLGLIAIGGIYKFCVYSGLVGAGLYYWVPLLVRKRNHAVKTTRAE